MRLKKYLDCIVDVVILIIICENGTSNFSRTGIVCLFVENTQVKYFLESMSHAINKK